MRETPKVEKLSELITNPNEIYIHDIVKGYRDFVRGKDSIHRAAFDVYACRVMHAILRIESMIDDYFEAMAENSP